MDSAHLRTPRARIAWLSQEGDSLARAAAQFAKAGYALTDPTGSASDLAIVDFRGARVTAKSAQELTALMRRRSHDGGIVYLASSLLGPNERAHLRRSGELVLVDEDLKPAIEVCRQRLRIRNIAEETGERLKTIAASTRLSEFPPIETTSAPPSVLVAGVPGAAALSALRAVDMVGENCAGALSARQAMRALETSAFDCAVFLVRSEGDPLMSLARSMRRHRKFQDMPIVIVSLDEAARGRIAAASGAETMPAEHLADDLGPRLVALARRARLMGAMRRFLRACAGEGVRDRISGAFTPQFFGRHAARIFERAEQTSRSVSVVGLRLSALAPGGRTKTLTEAAGLINRVTRAEDCMGRLSNDTFVALLSATSAADAEVAARRIEGVIANTMFRAKSKETPFAVAAATATVERHKGAPVEETIASVIAQLNAATPRTAER